MTATSSLQWLLSFPLVRKNRADNAAIIAAAIASVFIVFLFSMVTVVGENESGRNACRQHPVM
jgi:ABC-type branched-subunit amino acid transport system permease subunit